MKWTDFLDSTYIVNLPKRAQRRMESIKQMEHYDLPYAVWPAIEKTNGAEGLRETMLEVFNVALKNKFEAILVLEDDFEIVGDINSLMPQILDQLPKDFDMLYLGVNPWGGLVWFSENLLQINEGYATHSVIYSRKGMNKALMFLNASPNMPIDQVFAKYIQPEGKCYATFPLICSQRSGFSDIEGKDVNYQKLIETRYAEKVKAV